jgi:hypothetical protein
MRLAQKLAAVVVCGLALVAGCTSGNTADRDAAPDAVSQDSPGTSDVPEPPAVCSGTSPSLCATGPRGAVTTSSGPGDCFAAPTTGFVWQVAETFEHVARALFCGDIAAVLGSEGPLDYPACMAETAITTPTCHQTGGGSGTAPAKYEWYFQCASGCMTTIFFLEHGIAD